jgi:branched-subunit amino acid transport protein
MTDHEKLTIGTYLEQVKIITALATTLLITPTVILTLLTEPSVLDRIQAHLPSWRDLLMATNIAFLLCILCTYFIYSSVVGQANEGKLDIYRTATRVSSIAQFALLLIGATGLLFVLRQAM